MQLIRGLINLQPQGRDCVATIGNFDGVHIGHRALIKKVVAKAKLLKTDSVIILFEPHPKEVFMGENCPARISNFTEKYIQLATLGIDKLLVLQFNKSLREMPADEFIQNILIERLRVKHLVVGDDFRFGYKRTGDYSLLKKVGLNHFTVEPTPTLLVSEENLSDIAHRCSSSLVRDALAQNKLEFANKLLSRRYAMTGKVGHGNKLGSQIKFPTANVALNRKKTALNGVYLVRAKWREKGSYDDSKGSAQMHACWGVANCGSRPTVDGKNFRLEVHLLGVSPDLYGIELKVEFYASIRDEKKFESLDALKGQIQKDINRAKDLIKELS